MAGWWYKEKVWSGEKATLTVGLDLWGWALPLLIEKDYGEFRVRLLCFFLFVAWDITRRGKDVEI